MAGQYVLLPGGFADTASLPPGEGISQVIVGYNLPFSGKLDYSFLAPVAVEGVNFLVLESSGLTLQGDGLIPAGERTIEDGSKINVFKAPSLKPGESVQLTLSGKPGGEAAMDTNATQNTANTGIGIGAGILGLSLLGAGVWWWRRRGEEETKEISEDTVEGLLTEIQSLEQSYERGVLPEEEYQEIR